MIARFASDAGKKGGEFFTPSMVSELMARLVNPQENDRIYDPTCGSGSLLIRAFKKVLTKKPRFTGRSATPKPIPVPHEYVSARH
jgi:type I restriction enzyme M protein